MSDPLGKGVYFGSQNGGYACVEIGWQHNQSPRSILVCLDSDPRNDHLRTGAYHDWEAAAIYGCGFALDMASVDNGEWQIRRIIGQDCDTTASFVAVAAARAAWDLCGFQVPKSICEQLDAYARNVHYQDSPDFSHLTL